MTLSLSGKEAWMMIPADWAAVLADALHTPAWSGLTTFVDREREGGSIYPEAGHVFRAFELTPFGEVRVVILGQDPYHGEGQAHGLAFSVPRGKLPPSLRMIFKELERDPAVVPPEDGNLEGWASQGVLLLNTALTVRAGAPHSHRAVGWEAFTDAVISAVNKKQDRVVFLLWGAAADKKSSLITNANHTVIRAAHPAARASARSPLLTSGSFSRANQALIDAGRAGIDWGRSVTRT